MIPQSDSGTNQDKHEVVQLSPCLGSICLAAMRVENRLRKENWRQGYAGTRPLKEPWSKPKIASGKKART